MQIYTLWQRCRIHVDNIVWENYWYPSTRHVIIKISCCMNFAGEFWEWLFFKASKSPKSPKLNMHLWFILSNWYMLVFIYHTRLLSSPIFRNIHCFYSPVYVVSLFKCCVFVSIAYRTNFYIPATYCSLNLLSSSQMRQVNIKQLWEWYSYKI